MICKCKQARCYTNMCSDFSDTKWCGKSYVYVWLDKHNRPFYVGSGSGQRASQLKGRNEEFHKRLDENSAVWFVAENINPRFVFQVERYVTQFFLKQGYELATKTYADLYGKYGGTIPEKLVSERCNRAIYSFPGEWVQGVHEAILNG